MKSTKVDPLEIQVKLDKKSLARAEQDARAASERVASSRQAESDATDKVALAERRLVEARKTNATGSAAVLAAEQKLAQARRSMVTATTASARALSDDERAKRRVVDANSALEVSTRRAGSALGQISSALSRFDDTGIRRVEKGMSSAAGSALRLGAGVFGVASALTTIGSATGPILAIGSALTTAAGAAFLLPGVILAAGAAYATLKVGMSGVGDALKGDADALAQLAPAARATVGALTSFKDEWTQVKRAVQERLFANTAQDISLLATRYIPVLRGGMVGIAAGFNDAIKSATWFIASAQGVSNVTTILDGTAGASRNLGAAAGPLVGILTGIGAVGASMLPGLTSGFAGAAQRASDFVNSAAGAQQIRDWISGGLTAIQQLGQLLGNVGSIIFTVFSVANQVGGSTVAMLVQLTGEFRNWIQSAEGTAFLVSVFTTIRDTVQSLRPGVEAIWGALVGLVQQVGPLLPQIGTAFSNIAIAIAPLLSDLGSIVAFILPGVIWFVNLIAPAAGILAAMAGGVLVVVGAIRAWVAVQAAINFLMSMNPIGLLVLAIAALVAGVIYAWNNFEWFRTAVMGVWNFLKTVAGWVGSAFVAVWNALGAAFSWLGGVFSAVWVGFLKPVLDGFLAVAKFVGSLIIALVIGPLVLAWQQLSTAFRVAYDRILVPMFNAFSAIAQWLWLNVLLPVFGFIRAGWNALLTAFRWIYDTILVPLFNAFRVIADWLWRNVLSPIFTAIRVGWDGLAAAFRFIYDKIIKPVFDTFQSTAESFRGAFGRIVDGIKSIWEGIRNAFKAPVRFILDVIWNQGIGGLWNAAKSVFPLGEFPNANNALAALDRYATGGPVRGPGGPTSDKIPALLSNNEHVLTAAEVRAAGGHRSIEQMRAQIRSGKPVENDAMLALRRANGGPVTHQELWGEISGQFPRARLTSAKRNTNDQHGKGRAIDIAGPRSMDMPFMLDVNRWIAGKWGNSYELIHTQPGAVNLKRGKPHNYDAPTREGHRNHVHWSNDGAGIGAALGGAWDSVVSFVSRLTDSIASPEKWIRDMVGGAFPSGPGDPLTQRLPMIATDWAIKTAKDWLFKRAGEEDAKNPGGGLAPGGTGPIADQVRGVANRWGWGDGPQWNALVKLLGGESSWNPTAQNPRSTAYGLFQFLDATWGTVGGRKTSNAGEQAEYGFRYIKQRYQDPMGALAKWQSRSPHWYDTGGFLKPGVTKVFNGTGKPEPVLTAPQWEVASAAIEQVKRSRDLANVGRPAAVSRGQLFGDVHVHESVDMDAAMNRASFLAGDL